MTRIYAPRNATGRWYPASEKQKQAIRNLCRKHGKRQPTPEEEARWNNSSDIDRLFKYFRSLPKPAPTPGRTDEPEAGMYRDVDGTIYRVYFGQQSGRMLVKRVVKTGGTWVDREGTVRDEYKYVYVGNAAYKLPATAESLPAEAARAWGRLTRSCVVCARQLDVPESVDAGIGPKCAKGF